MGNCNSELCKARPYQDEPIEEASITDLMNTEDAKKAVGHFYGESGISGVVNAERIKIVLRLLEHGVKKVNFKKWDFLFYNPHA